MSTFNETRRKNGLVIAGAAISGALFKGARIVKPAFAAINAPISGL
jgi:hypothetical protein